MTIPFNLDDPQTSKEFTSLLDYVFGITDEAPGFTTLNLHPNRVAHFFARFLDNNGLRVVHRSQAPQKAATSIPPAVAAERARADDSDLSSAVDEMTGSMKDGTECTWRWAWNSTPVLRDHFGGNEDNYLALMRREAADAARRERRARHRADMAKARGIRGPEPIGV